MTAIRKIFSGIAARRNLIFGAALLLAGPAAAQTPPGWTFGQVPTPAQWNGVFASKQDYLGAPPLLTSGGTMLGPLVTAASSAANAGFSMKPGAAPTSPNNGDMWVTTTGLFARVNGVTLNLFGVPCPTCAVTNATNTFTAAQIISLNSSALPALLTGSVLQIASANGTPTRIELDSFGSQSFFTTRCAGGTAAAPTALAAATQCGGYNMHGFDGTAWGGPAASFRTFANQTWGVGAHGTYAEIGVTANGSASMVPSIRFEADGGITVPPSVSGGSKGAGTINVTGLYAGNVTASASGGGPIAAFLATATNPAYAWQATGQPADQKLWDVIVIGGNLQFRALNDANNAPSVWLTAARGAGATVSSVNVGVPFSIGGCAPTVTFCSAGSAYFNSSSATAFVVGPSGITNPALNIDLSAASAATGINVKSAAAGGGVSITTLSSGANEDLILNAKGTGRLATNSSVNISPATGSLTQGLQITQSPTGTITGGTPFVFTTANAANYINMTSDTVDMGDGNEYSALAIIHKTGGASVLGMRSGLHVEQWLTAATGAETQKDISAATFQLYAQNGNSGGNFITASFIGQLLPGATGSGGLTGIEIDIIASATVQNKIGFLINQITNDTFHGSINDVALLVFNAGGIGWNRGLQFGVGTISTGGVVIDASALTIGDPAYFLKGPGSRFVVDGSGNIAANTIDVLPGSGTPIIVSGTSSGQGTFSVPAALGSANWLLPTGSGTFAVTASSPIVNNAATGNLTCPTCATSAAALTLNQIVIGSGSQGAQSLGSLGSATTVLHGGTGAPSFSAVVLSTDVSGILPVANGGTGISSLGTGVATWLATPSSANLAAAVTDETGTAALVFANNPTLNSPNINTPVINGASTGSGVATANTASTLVARDASGNFSAGTIIASLTGHASLDLALSSLGTGVQTALGINVGSAGGPVTFNGAGGTPSSIALTNGTGLPTTGLTGTLQAAQEPAHTGDVTNSAGSLALTIANNAVTFAKMATQAANTVVVNATSGTAVPTAQAVGSCDTATKALQWTTNTGFACNSSITATTNANLTGDVTSAGNATTLVTSQPAVHTWVLAQTFTVAPVFTDQSGSRTALGLGTMATQAASAVAITGGTIAGLTGLAVRDTSAAFDVTLAAVSSATLSAGRTLTLDMGNVAHTLKFGTTANTITFPNVASDTVGMLATTQTWTGVNSYSTNAHYSVVGGTGAGIWFASVTTGADRWFFGTDASLADSYRVFSALSGSNLLQVAANATASLSTTTITGTLLVSALTNVATTSAVCYNTATGLISYDGTIGTCTISDERFKDYVGPIEHALDRLLTISGFYYNWKNPDLGSGRQIGVGAQTVERAFPELVQTDWTGRKSMDYQRLTAPIIEALRELKSDNDNLRLELLELKNGTTK